jgi:5-methylcytosine-specific restriction enzyme A
MPTRPKKPCGQPGCRELVEAGQGYCPAHKRQKQKRVDEQRGSSADRGYGGAWQKARAHYLRAHPLCVYCEREGITKAAEVVDHITPHKGDWDLFWDSDNWQSLCKRHHDIKTATVDGGFGFKKK